ncbi:MAG: cyclic nucleotide-binding domain-containing protein, partial [Gammaproteobacteria bacterium]|nr:cyclic nucleotide-binding domain-containing protein [Gammaproteobacteria bacterium]
MLQQSSCFRDLDTEQLASIILCCERVVLNDGDFMIMEGERDNRDFFVLLSGTVEIVSNNTDTISNEVVLSKEDKDLYGELSWLTGRKRSASARCRGEVEAARVDGNALM